MKHRGFTLIELLIVVAIIAILAAIAVPNLMNAQIRAKVARTQSEQRTLAGALENYFAEHGTYPPERADSANDPGGYRYLTSPIPYLTRIMPDPFMKKYVNSRGNEFDTKYEFMVTWPGNTANMGRNNRPSGVPKTTMYNIEAVGPDGIDSFRPTPAYPSHPADFEFYDPSNGLMSYGDILRAGGEYLPRWMKERKGGKATTGADWL
jgi:type II secretion system protein G